MFFLILGAHRSGTSATAGLLASLGINPGQRLLPANEFNAKGYFEPANIVSFNERLLADIGLSWSDITLITPDVLEPLLTHDRLAEARKLLGDEFPESTEKLLKDPRLCRLLPFWQAVFSEMGEPLHYIITLRQPDHVIQSLTRRDSMAVNHAALLYAVHLLDAERHTRACSRLLLSYQHLLEAPHGVLCELDGVFGTDFSHHEAQALEAAHQFISQELNHARLVGITLPESRCLAFARAVFAAFVAGIGQERQQIFDQLWHEYETIQASLEPWLTQARQMEGLRQEIFLPGKLMNQAGALNGTTALYWKSSSLGYHESATIKLPYGFCADEQTLLFNFPTGLPALTALRLDLTDRPAFVDLREVVLQDAQGQECCVLQGSDAFLNVSPDMKVINEQEGRPSLFLFTGFDPNGQLAIPKACLEQISEGWSLRVRAVIQLPVKAISPLWQRYERIFRELQHARHDLLSMEQAMLEKQHTLEGVSSALAESNAKLSGVRAEIVRAEAQLALLKELMLDDGKHDKISFS